MRAVNLYDQISESVFTTQIIQMARVFGWRCAHFRPAMTKRGRWVTAMSGDIGFPDLVLVRPPRMIFAELKSAKGKLTPDQVLWLEAIRQSDIEQYEWRPKDIANIETILR